MVSTRAHRDGATLRLGGRQTSHLAVNRTAFVSESLKERKMPDQSRDVIPICPPQPLQPPHAGDCIGLEFVSERIRSQARHAT